MSETITIFANAAEKLGRILACRARLILRATSVALLVLAILAPLLLAAGASGGSSIIYSSLSPICHQQADRCIHLASGPMAFCARCTGGYLGFVLISGLTASLCKRIRWIAKPAGLAVMLGGLDFVLQAIGLYDSVNLHRIITGLLFGAGIGFFVFRFLGESSAPAEKSVHVAADIRYIGREC